jgi:ubiquinone/menaquinone biosynthesis C-methylase UbiE
MARHVRVREILAGFTGLGLLRGLLDGEDRDAEARVEELRRVLDAASDEEYGAGFDTPELTVVAGYSVWASTYDKPGNPVISAEQPAVWSLLAELPLGRAVDAACGTGRHTRRLAELGHDVLGVDTTRAMLDRARATAPRARFVIGDLRALPVAPASVDLVTCSLALDHAPDLLTPVAEMARVVRPGGRVIISDVHPVLSALGIAAFFRAEDGSTAFVRNHRHLLGEYLDAFAAAGLEVCRCLEQCYGPGEVAMQRVMAAFSPDGARAAFLGLPATLVWDLVRR